MKYRKLGGIDVSTIALGCWGFAGGSMWGETEEKESIATIHAAMGAGINLLDTAEGYGDGLSEEIVGKALKGRRDGAVVATKVGPAGFRPADLRAACERSLARLATDYVDLYQLHWPDRQGIPMAEVVGELERLASEGKIRLWGVCNFGVPDLAELPEGPAVSNQLAYSLLFRGIEFEILPRCRDLSMGVLVYSGLMHGILSGRYLSADEVPEGRARTRHFRTGRPGVRHGESGQEELTFGTLAEIREISRQAGRSMSDVALAWLLAQPGVASILAGARSRGQAVQNAAIGDVALPGDVLDAVTAATARLKEAMGGNPDMWQGEGSRIRWGEA